MEILDVEQVARELDVSEQTIYRLARDGDIPAFKVGNQWRFDRQALEDWKRGAPA